MYFYVLLGLERGANVSDIKRAYKRLARRFHPDINPGDRMAAAQFRQIAEAYETLSDSDRRRRYDTGGADNPALDHGTFGFDGFDFSVSVGGSSASTFGELFAEVLQQRARKSEEGTPERGADLHQSITFRFEDAMRGGERQITVTRQEHCRACGGTGRLEAGGRQITVTRQEHCRACGGTGRLETGERRCLHCHAAGIVRSARGHMVFSK